MTREKERAKAKPMTQKGKAKAKTKPIQKAREKEKVRAKSKIGPSGTSHQLQRRSVTSAKGRITLLPNASTTL